jgi:carboxymethylenebutenolidase
MRLRSILHHAVLAAVLLPAGISALAQEKEQPPPNAQEVTFTSPRGVLHGFLYKPEGRGPFPAVLWNHGSEKRPGWQLALADFYLQHGFVFFMPHRLGHGRSPGPYIMDQVEQVRGRPGAAEAVVRLHEQANADVVAALEWLKQQPFVDANRIVVSGLSFGGIQTLLTAEKGLGVKAFVAFAPGANSWPLNAAVRDRLTEAAKNAKGPVFILQAENDYDLGPAKVLGKRLKPPGGSKIYPAYGSTTQEGHAGFATQPAGIAIWQQDVLDFLRNAGVK